MGYKILIIDDDVELSHLLQDCLQEENIMADLVHDGLESLSRIKNETYQLIVLDVMLPGISGFGVLAELRTWTTTPVLMLTARNDEVDKVSGLRMGADDYLTKPFSIQEFIARVQALIRRYTAFSVSQGKIHSFGMMTIDQDQRMVTICDRRVDLTSKEFDVLDLLSSHQGRVFTKKQIYNQVWQEDYAFDDNNIMSYMSKLRKKLENAGADVNYVQTVWGVGYRFNPQGTI